ncbi:MAG: hypothetical protein QXI19_05120 [Candidatus Caldarchaeum sp.]
MLKTGEVIENCYVKDEGIRVIVWKSLSEVGKPGMEIPRRLVASYKIERDERWDEHPPLPDLSVTFIELNPKLAGLHGLVHYDPYGRPKPAGRPFADLGEQSYITPESLINRLKLTYEPGEPITLTAHVKNVGFTSSQPFEYRWYIDSIEVGRGRYEKSLSEMEEVTFTLRWFWQPGQHTARFEIKKGQPEIAVINNALDDPLWGFSFVFIVHKGRVSAWHQNRTAYGTFSFEDFYRWHIDIMNLLFEHSVYPSAPEGIKARVRLDRIIYTDNVEQAIQDRTSSDGVAYDQGAWIWLDDQDRTQKWTPPTKEWRNQTEWSLPHELGHQLGLTDLYALDYAGSDDHIDPVTGEKITHFMTRPITMMHWHGPHLWSELDAGYLNATLSKPRGYYGDSYFAIPRECFLHFLDVNGKPLRDAKVEIFQRGVAIQDTKTFQQQEGVTFFDVVEDGRFDHPVSKDPVIIGITKDDGTLRLPNRPVKHVKTNNGFERLPNPFGNINVVGQRGLMLVRVTYKNMHAHFWLEIFDFNVAWFRGMRERFTMVLHTPFPSADSPPPPAAVQAERIDENLVRIRWAEPSLVRDQHYFDRVVGYRVYRRIGNDGLNDRPWFPVATVNSNTREVIVDLREFPEDIYWFSKTNRFAVATLGENGIASGLVEVVLKNPPRSATYN